MAKKSPAQLQHEIDAVLSKRSHSTIKTDEQWAASVAERRQRDPGAWSSRAQLVSISRAAANNVFFSRKVMTPALIKKAREADVELARAVDARDMMQPTMCGLAMEAWAVDAQNAVGVP